MVNILDYSFNSRYKFKDTSHLYTKKCNVVLYRSRTRLLYDESLRSALPFPFSRATGVGLCLLLLSGLRGDFLGPSLEWIGLRRRCFVISTTLRIGLRVSSSVCLVELSTIIWIASPSVPGGTTLSESSSVLMAFSFSANILLSLSFFALSLSCSISLLLLSGSRRDWSFRLSLLRDLFLPLLRDLLLPLLLDLLLSLLRERRLRSLSLSLLWSRVFISSRSLKSSSTWHFQLWVVLIKILTFHFIGPYYLIIIIYIFW